jgi:cyclomaltodextrinase / maltogenic alpha-amylase / neopullulanase
MNIPLAARLQVLAALLLLGFPPGTPAARAQDPPLWSRNLGIYEVNTRQYTYDGTFNAFLGHVDRLKRMNAGILWFMPIHPIGVKNRLGSLGSYYSVKDYHGVNPEFGTLDDFIALVDSIHHAGMYVMMDWVANHTSWDNVWTVSHPEFYVHDGTGNFTPPPGTGWSDVIQLDFTRAAMRDSMIAAMRWWITAAGIDGFRFDAASRIPTDFWSAASDSLRRTKPDILLLAEDQDQRYYSAGMQMTFAWSYYGWGGGALIDLVKGTINANGFAEYVAAEESAYPGNKLRMYFTSNHDENSWTGTDQQLFGAATDAFIALSHTFRGVPLDFGGQEAGLDHMLKFFDKDSISWQSLPREKLITRLLTLKRNHRALWNGQYGSPPVRMSTTSNGNVYAFTREKAPESVLGIFNLSGSSSTTTLLGSNLAGEYIDVLGDSLFVMKAYQSISLPAWGFRVFYRVVGDAVEPAAMDVPSGMRLEQNWPNPFNPTTTLRVTLGPNAVPGDGLTKTGRGDGSHGNNARIAVYDLLGREVAVIADGALGAGEHAFTFDAKGLSSGTYICRLTAGRESRSIRMLLLR